MHSNRRAARILAMQILSQWEVQGERSAPCVAELATEEATQPPQSVLDYASSLVDRFLGRREAVDSTIGVAAKNWSLDRISVVERNVLRIAATEMLESLVPLKVAVNEAIEIADAYGGADSGRFVNGVLDEILKGCESSAQPPPSHPQVVEEAASDNPSAV